MGGDELSPHEEVDPHVQAIEALIIILVLIGLTILFEKVQTEHSWTVCHMSSR